MTPNDKTSLPVLRRRDFGLGALAFGAAACSLPVRRGPVWSSWEELPGT